MEGELLHSFLELVDVMNVGEKKEIQVPFWAILEFEGYITKNEINVKVRRCADWDTAYTSHDLITYRVKKTLNETKINVGWE